MPVSRSARWLIVGSLALAGCPMPRPPVDNDVVVGFDRPQPDVRPGDDIVVGDAADVPVATDADAGATDDSVVAADVLDFDDFAPDEGFPDVGEACSAATPCLPLARCVSNVCVALPGAGESCTDSGSRCQGALQCVDGVCTPAPSAPCPS